VRRLDPGSRSDNRAHRARHLVAHARAGVRADAGRGGIGADAFGHTRSRSQPPGARRGDGAWDPCIHRAKPRRCGGIRRKHSEAGAMKDLQRRLVVLVSGLLLLAAVFVSYRAGERFERSLTQQRLGVELEIGRSVAVVVEKALAFGVPFGQLVDTERFLEAVKFDNPGVDYIIITTLDGQLRYSPDLGPVTNIAGLRRSLADWSGREHTARIAGYFNTATAINGKDRQICWLHLGERANIIEQLLREIVFDILTVLVVAMLVAFELMRLLLAASFSTPSRAINEFFARVASG